jgi:hypothetical protein
MSGPSNRVLEIQGGLFADRTALIPGKIYIYIESRYTKICIMVYIINMAISEANASESISLR